MDLPEPVNTRVTYSDSAPLILAASSDRAMRLARSTADHSGFRIAAELPIAAAAARLGQQAALSSLWIEIDEDGAELDSLLALAARESRDGR